MWKILGKILWLRSLWVAVCGALIHYHYTTTHPELDIWDGYVLVVGWALLQLCVMEITAVACKSIDSLEDLDAVLIVVVVFAVAVVTGSLALDFMPTNRTSVIFSTANVLPVYQCDAIVGIAEAHAQWNLHNFLKEADVDPLEINDAAYAALPNKTQQLVRSRGWLTDRHAKYPTTDMSAYSIQQNITLRNYTSTNDGTFTTYSMDFLSWLNETIDGTILPILERQYDLAPREPYEVHAKLAMKDLFIVKYSAELPDSQRDLQLHTDASQLSFTIALSTLLGEDDIGTGNSEDDHGQTGLPPADQQCQMVTNDDVSGDGDGSCSAAPVPVASAYRGGGTYFHRANRTVHTAKGSMLSHPSRLYHAGSEITSGTRYLLVGFVEADRYKRNTWYRRFGMCSSCVRFSLFNASAPANETQNTRLKKTPLQWQQVWEDHGQSAEAGKWDRAGEDSSDLGGLFASQRGQDPDLHCQPYLWVVAYEVYALLAQLYANARTSRRSMILFGVVAMSVVSLGLAVVSALVLFVLALTEGNSQSRTRPGPGSTGSGHRPHTDDNNSTSSTSNSNDAAKSTTTAASRRPR